MGKDEASGTGSLEAIAGGRKPAASTSGERRPVKRFWAKHKTEVVLRLLRGEDLESVSRSLGVPAATLSDWRDAFLAAGAEGFKPRTPAEEAEAKRLNAKIGEQAMEIELLREKIALLEGGRPLARRRSRR